MVKTPYQLAERFMNVQEVPGQLASPQIMSMLTLDAEWPEDDSVPWCSAFVNYICWLLDIPRSRSLRARSWLNVGESILLDRAQRGFDIVIFKRGSGVQPGPEVINAPGHVAFFSSFNGGDLARVLGGNQSDSVNHRNYPIDRILGIRRLAS